MIRPLTILGTFALAATTSTVFAQQGGQQQPPARGLDTALAVEAAQTAVNTCLDSGVKGSAAVVMRPVSGYRTSKGNQHSFAPTCNDPGRVIR